MRTFSSLLSGCVLLAMGCQGKAPAPKPSAPASVAALPPAPSASALAAPAAEALAKRYVESWEAFNRSDFERLGTFYAPDAVSRAPDSGLADEQGRQAIIDRRKKAWKTAFPDGKLAPQIVLVNGFDVVATGILSGEQTGPLMAADGLVPATKKPIGQLAFHWARFDVESLVRDEAWLVDRGSQLYQLGKNPKKGRARSAQGLVNAPVVLKSSGDATERANVAVVEQSWRAMAEESLPAVAALLADDVVLADQTVPEDARGKGPALGAIDVFLRAWSELKLDCKTRFGAANYVVSVCAVTATHDGDFGALKRTGRRVAFTLAELVRLDGGLEKEIVRVFDGAHLTQVLSAKGAP